MEVLHQDTQGYRRQDVVWGGVKYYPYLLNNKIGADPISDLPPNYAWYVKLLIDKKMAEDKICQYESLQYTRISFKE